MTREEAAHILAVAENAAESDVTNKYNELHNEYQIRLTNAPTPNLKKLYQKNLQELNEAANVLLKGQTSGLIKELPSSAPIFNADEKSETPKPPSTQASYGNAALNLAPKKNSQPAKTSKGVYIFGILAVVLLASTILFFIFYNEQKKAAAEQDGQLQSVIASNDSLTTVLGIFSRNFSNGQMEVSNKGSQPLNITWLIVSYMDSNGDIIKLEKWMDVDIRGGSSEKLEVVDGSKVIWDGSVISYAFGINYAGRELIQSGIWSNDAVDGALVLNFDK